MNRSIRYAASFAVSSAITLGMTGCSVRMRGQDSGFKLNPAHLFVADVAPGAVAPGPDLSVSWAPQFQNIVGYWKLDAADLDAAIDRHPVHAAIGPDGFFNNSDLSILPTTGAVVGQVNQGVLFDGLNDGVEVADHPAFNFLDALSISVWIKPAGWGGIFAGIVTKGDNSYRLQRCALNNAVSFDLNGLTGGALCTTRDLDDGGWHHIVAVYGGQLDPYRRIYVDGTLDAEVAVSGILQNSMHALMIGGNSEVANRAFLGAIDEVALWNVGLSAAQVAEIYAGQRGGH